VLISVVKCCDVLQCCNILSVFFFIVVCMVMFCIILFNSVSYVFLLLCLCIHVVVCTLFCIFCFNLVNWQSSATIIEVFPCFFLSCKTNGRV
jgi:hypothetical protein